MPRMALRLKWWQVRQLRAALLCAIESEEDRVSEQKKLRGKQLITPEYRNRISRSQLKIDRWKEILNMMDGAK